MNPLTINADERILIIAPHPDDECIGAGGLLSQYAPQCEVWLLTNGSKGSSRYACTELVDIREAEFIKEMQLLQPHDFRIFRFEDGSLSNHLDCLDGENLSSFNKIFVTNKFDSHIDHRSAFQIVKHALSNNRYQVDVYQYEISQPLQEATHYLDISQVVEQKQLLIGCHESQLMEYDYCKKAISLNSYRSVPLKLKGGFAEVYCLTDMKYEDTNQISFLDARIRRQNVMLDFYEKWLNACLHGFSLEKRLQNMKICTVAIYGYGKIGRLLEMSLIKCQEIKLLYIIDKRSRSLQSERVPLVHPEEKLDVVDLLIVTVLEEYDLIEICMKEKGFGNIMHLKRLLEEE